MEEANLVRRREEVAENLTREVIDLVLNVEQLDRRLDSLEGQLQTQRQRQAVMEARYRTGQGSTDQMLRMWQRTDDLQARIDETAIARGQTVRELEVLCNANSETEIDSTPAAPWMPE